MDAGLLPALLALVEPDERGDPMSPLRWTTKSTRMLATTLTAHGHRGGADIVARLLHREGFSLQSNAKTLEGKKSPDRDAQFRYINDEVKAHCQTGTRFSAWMPRRRNWRATTATQERNGGGRVIPAAEHP